MSSETHATQPTETPGHKSHALPIPLLVGTWLALMGLTVLTVWLAQHHLGKIDFLVAMLIATVKASLVALIFMHLLWDKGFHSVLMVSGVLFLALFLGTTLFDRAHYQKSIEDLVRDHPPTRTHELIQGEDHPEDGHGEEAGEGGETEEH